MGLFGSAIGGSIAQTGGQELGNFIGKKTHSKLGGKIAGGVLGAVGRVGGTILGAGLPFATGGRVNAPKHMPVKAILHGQEYVLPVGIKPTKAQVKAVAMIKRDAKKK